MTTAAGNDKRFAPLERTALATLMRKLGPNAPTLCEGWTTRDLAAHLVVRGSRIDAAGGIVVPVLAGHLRTVQERVAARPWSQLLADVGKRPWWAPPPLDELVNRVEYYVHHEDVRRAQPDWQPRDLPVPLSAALWSRVRTQAKLVLRRTPAAVTVTAPEHGSVVAGRGGAGVDLIGDPQELLLFLMGRQNHARVELAGPEKVVRRMAGARYGI